MNEQEQIWMLNYMLAYIRYKLMYLLLQNEIRSLQTMFEKNSINSVQ